MKIITETRPEEENRSEKSSLKLAQGVCIDRGEKIFRRPFRLGSRVGNSPFYSSRRQIYWKQLDSNRSLKPIAITKVTPRLFITAKQAKWFQANPSKVCLSLLRTASTIDISFTIHRGINNIYLQEMWHLSSNIHRKFLSTITVGEPGPKQSQSYRQSLSGSRFLRLICAFFISVSFHKDVEFICPRTCISYLQIISTTEARKTAICPWLDKRLKRLD